MDLIISMQKTSHTEALHRSRQLYRGHSIINAISVLRYYQEILDTVSYEYLNFGLEIVPVALPIISHHSTFAYNLLT